MAEINTFHISSNLGTYELARDNAFRFVISDKLDTLLPAGLQLAAEEDYLTGCKEKIELATSSASVPHFAQETIPVKRGNMTVNYASTPTYGDESFVCTDFVGTRVKDILLAWQSLSFDVNTGVIPTADKYKVDCELIEYTPDFSKIVRSWTLYGCFITGISENNFSHDTANKREISVTVKYDYAKPNPKG